MYLSGGVSAVTILPCGILLGVKAQNGVWLLEGITLSFTDKLKLSTH